MRAVVGSKQELEQLALVVDQALGFPLAGVDVGDGIHAPPEESVTLRYAGLRENPITREWAYPLDATCRPVVAAKQVADGKIADPKAVTLAGEAELSAADWIVTGAEAAVGPDLVIGGP